MTEQAPRDIDTNDPGSDWARTRGEKWRSNFAGMEATLAPIDEPLIRALQLDRPLRIAEVGSGGGGTTLAIARQAVAGSSVHGFDISPALVARARERIPEAQHAVAFELADMATAPSPSPPYDRLVSRFGIMFFADPPAAFANLAHWLAPGGRFAFAVWGPTTENLWMRSVREVVAEVVTVPAADPDAPGPFRYAQVDGLLELLARAGFAQLDVQTWRGKLPVGGALQAAEAAKFALLSLANFGELLAQAGDAAVERARDALTVRFAPHVRDGAVQLDAAVHIVTGGRA